MKAKHTTKGGKKPVTKGAEDKKKKNEDDCLI